MSTSYARPRFGLQLLPEEELIGYPHPERCVELSFGPHQADDDVIVFSLPVRITPADLVRLRMEAELTLGEIRVEVMRAEIAWKQALGEWFEEGRAAVEAKEPDVALLARVLEGLQNEDLVPA